MTLAKPLLSLRDIKRTFDTPAGAVHVLKEVDLDVFPGDFIALTGPSGSGKTTLLNIISLLDHPTAGQMTFDDQQVSRLSPRQIAHLRQEKMGMVFQRFHLLSRRTALDNAAFRFRYTATPRHKAKALALEALKTVGMADLASRQTRLLSGGEMQRVAIARAIASPPLILLADEPTGNLDGDAAVSVMELFQSINQQGVAIILATHNKSLLQYCSRHVTCAQGTITERSVSDDA